LIIRWMCVPSDVQFRRKSERAIRFTQQRSIRTARDREVHIWPGVSDWITLWASEKYRKEAE